VTVQERPKTFEEGLARLEEIVASLDRGEAPLEEGLRLFEEGVTLTRRCHEMLSAAEERVSRLVKTDERGEVRLEPFDGEDTR
jgi:exodeoxyribonuclease VII small subunit